ncbi:MAG TPA: hypothetical protein VGP06_10180 [Janthinobacterium sp.]|jgi:hypothetical protein|nr:hypothetical protein [Janthinobacterium sp.]
MKTFLFLFLMSGAALADDAAVLRCRQLGDAGQRLSCYDKIEVGKGDAAVATPAVTRQTQEKAFGMEVQQAKKQEALESFDSSIPGKFEGWGPHQRITLANGQVWQISDGSEGIFYKDKPRVRLVRGLLGAIYMEIEGSNKSPKVKRVQ